MKPSAKFEANLERMNEHSRELYHGGVKLVDMINKNVPLGHQKAERTGRKI